MSRVEAYLAQVEERRRRISGVRRYSWLALGLSLAIAVICQGFGEAHWLTMYLGDHGQIICTVLGIAAFLWGILAHYRPAFLAGIAMIGGGYFFWNRPVLFSGASKPSTPALRVLSINIEEASLDASGQMLTQCLDRTRPDIIVMQGAEIIKEDPVFRKTFKNYTVLLTGTTAIATNPKTCDVKQVVGIDFPTLTHRYAQGAVVEWNKKRFTIANVEMRPRLFVRRGKLAYGVKTMPSDAILKNPKSTKEQKEPTYRIETQENFGLGSLPSHFSESLADRAKQFDVLVSYLKDRHGPLILTGDFDFPPMGPMYSTLSQAYADAWKAAGSGTGATYEGRRTQYTFVSEHIKVNSATVELNAGADHQPLLTVIEFTKADNEKVELYGKPGESADIEWSEVLQLKESERKSVEKRTEKMNSAKAGDPKTPAGKSATPNVPQTKTNPAGVNSTPTQPKVNPVGSKPVTAPPKATTENAKPKPAKNGFPTKWAPIPN